jgi:hypothetical protein
MIAGALLLWIFLASHEHEPSYEGRTLSQWLTAYYHDQSVAEATNAVHHIGTNALPFLVKWISYKIPSWRTGPIDHLMQNSGTLRAYAALGGFEILGPEGGPAAPALNNVLGDWDKKSRATVERALFALSYMGNPGLAPLVSLVTNKSAPPVYRREAAARIRESVTRLDTNASWTVPVLIGSFNDREVARMIARVLGDLRLEPALAVPALTRSLQNDNTLTAIESAKSLGNFGTNASVAVPELRKALNSNNEELRIAATNALEIIAPEVLKKDGH